MRSASHGRSLPAEPRGPLFCGITSMGDVGMQKVRFPAWILAMLGLASMTAPAAPRSAFTLSQILYYPYASELAAAEHGDVIAWVRNVDGVRNIWMARGPGFAPLQLTQYTADDGQELTQLTFSPDGTRLVFVRGGDNDSNSPAGGNL